VERLRLSLGVRGPAFDNGDHTTQTAHPEAIAELGEIITAEGLSAFSSPTREND